MTDAINKTIQTIEEEFERHEKYVRRYYFLWGFFIAIPIVVLIQLLVEMIF